MIVRNIERGDAWVIFLAAAGLISLGWGVCFGLAALLWEIAGPQPDCHPMLSDSGCSPLAGIALTLAMVGAFGAPLFLLGIVGCLFGAAIAFLVRSKA